MPLYSEETVRSVELSERGKPESGQQAVGEHALHERRKRKGWNTHLPLGNTWEINSNLFKNINKRSAIRRPQIAWTDPGQGQELCTAPSCVILASGIRQKLYVFEKVKPFNWKNLINPWNLKAQQSHVEKGWHDPKSPSPWSHMLIRAHVCTHATSWL